MGEPAIAPAPPSPWLTADEAAARMKCGVKLIYSMVKAGRLRAATIGGRRSLRLRAEWCDDALEAMSTPQPVTPRLTAAR